MKISCPECHFESDVPEEALPKRTAIATCPKCKCKFRFSPTDGVLGKIDPPPEVQPEEPKEPEKPKKEQEVQDDPLPEGAIVIGSFTNGAKSQDAESAPKPKKQPEKKSLLAHLFEKKKPVQDDEQEFTSESKQEAQDVPRDKAKPRQASEAEEERAVLPKRVGHRRTSNPWDRAPGRIGYLASFYQTCLRVMLAPPRFFANLSPKQPYHPALIFYIIICVIEFCLNYMWISVFRNMISGSNDPDLTALFALLAPQGNVFLRLLLQTGIEAIKLYLFTALFYGVLQVIAPKNNSFQLIYQVVAYSTAPSLLCIVPIAGTLAGMLWSIACLIIGLRAALKITWSQTLVAFLPIILFFTVLLHCVGTIPM